MIDPYLGSVQRCRVFISFSFYFESIPNCNARRQIRKAKKYILGSDHAYEARNRDGKTIYYLVWQSGRQVSHILPHSPRPVLSTKEMKLKFITLKEIQLHRYIMQ